MTYSATSALFAQSHIQQFPVEDGEESSELPETSPDETVRELGAISWTGGHLVCMAKSLEPDVACANLQPSDPILKVLSPSLGFRAFPTLQGLLDIANGVWVKPALVFCSARKLEAMCKVKEEGCKFLFTQLTEILSRCCSFGDD